MLLALTSFRYSRSVAFASVVYSGWGRGGEGWSFIMRRTGKTEVYMSTVSASTDELLPFKRLEYREQSMTQQTTIATDDLKDGLHGNGVSLLTLFATSRLLYNYNQRTLRTITSS